MIINPLVLGKGVSMFTGIEGKIDLKFLQAKALDSGVVILYYTTVKR